MGWFLPIGSCLLACRLEVIMVSVVFISYSCRSSTELQVNLAQARHWLLF